MAAAPDWEASYEMTVHGQEIEAVTRLAAPWRPARASCGTALMRSRLRPSESPDTATGVEECQVSSCAVSPMMISPVGASGQGSGRLSSKMHITPRRALY